MKTKDSILSHQNWFAKKRLSISCFFSPSHLPQIGTVNEDTLDDNSEDEGVLELSPGRVINVVLDIDKIKLVVLDLLPLPIVFLV